MSVQPFNPAQLEILRRIIYAYHLLLTATAILDSDAPLSSARLRLPADTHTHDLDSWDRDKFWTELESYSRFVNTYERKNQSAEHAALPWNKHSLVCQWSRCLAGGIAFGKHRMAMLERLVDELGTGWDDWKVQTDNAKTTC